MAQVIDLFPKNEDETIAICCSECEGVHFIPLLHRGQLFFQCADPDCEEIYELVELQEAEVH